MVAASIMQYEMGDLNGLDRWVNFITIWLWRSVM